MKKNSILIPVAILFFLSGIIVSSVSAEQQQQAGYILEHEKDIAVNEPGPHKGGGNSIAHRFFTTANNSRLQFTKRILHPGAGIGYHLQKEEEIYYIASGTGEMTINDRLISVQAGDGILTLPGNWHGLKQTGTEDLVVIINYEKK